MIDEIQTVERLSQEFISHEYLVAKINELIRAHNAKELAATDSQQLQAAIALLQRWVGAVDGNWQISEITDDTREFLEQRVAM